MKIEKQTVETPKSSSIIAVFRGLENGQQVRLKTAADMYGFYSCARIVSRERGIKIGTRKDGDDVLVYIKSTTP